MLPLKRQGKHLTLRTEKGVIKAHATVQAGDAKPQTWRRALSRLTNGGKDIHEVLIDLMHGNGYTPRIFGVDGKEDTSRRCEPIIPTPEVRRQAAMNLHEMLHGKAVAETEVRASENEAALKLQLESMSDDQLQRYIDGEYKMIEVTGNESEIPETTPQGEGDEKE